MKKWEDNYHNGLIKFSFIIYTPTKTVDINNEIGLFAPTNRDSELGFFRPAEMFFFDLGRLSLIEEHGD